MTDDEKAEHAVAACRRAITRWIESDGEKGGRQLRDSLHALSACKSSRLELRESAMPKRRRKAA